MIAKSRLLKRAAAYGLTPPSVALLAVRFTDDAAWDRSLMAGAALWIVLAMALSAVAVARLERHSTEHGRP
jgi:hypothetical protein